MDGCDMEPRGGLLRGLEGMHQLLRHGASSSPRGDGSAEVSRTDTPIRSTPSLEWGCPRGSRRSLDPSSLRKPRTIFVNSMSDLFHELVSDRFIEAVWQVMRDTPRHQYQILTKRPERMAAFVKKRGRNVLPNVWLGTSVENAEVVDRIRHLRRAPAAIRFISFEPLIGPVGRVNLTGIQWAIVGGESGRGARPIREEWIDAIYEQCVASDTAFFFKQWGAWGKDAKRRSKKANGREYRGKTWNEMPVRYQSVD